MSLYTLAPETQIMLHFALKSAIFEIQRLAKVGKKIGNAPNFLGMTLNI